MAQVLEAVDEIATAVRPFPRLDVGVGVCRSVEVPSPSLPALFDPQQDTKPLSRIAQVVESSTEIATAVRPFPRPLIRVGVCRSVVVPSPS